MPLRPSLTIYQEFVTPSPTIVAPSNPLVIVGINRQLEWRTQAGNFQGGQINPSYNFPNLSSGAVVEQPGAVDPVLEPHVFIQGEYGVAEIPVTYNFGVSPPVFDISPTVSATFEISSGTTGSYSSTSGKFLDANADFIEDKVGAGDVIKVNGVHSFDVTAIISDTELDVTRKDKGPSTYTADLTVEDGNGDRTLTDVTIPSAYDFEAAGVQIGDIVTVEGWDFVTQGDGIDYTVAAPPARTVTGPTQNFSSVLPPVVVNPTRVDLIWMQKPGLLPLTYVPLLKVNSVTNATTLVAENLLTSPTPNPAYAGTGESEPFEIYHYYQQNLDPVTGPTWVDAGNGSYTALGAGGALPPNQRWFVTVAGPIVFPSILPPAPPYVNYFIVAWDANGLRPVFWIDAIDLATDPTGHTLIVRDVDPQIPGNVPGAGITWELWFDGGLGPVNSYLGASISVENTGDFNKRTLSSNFNDFPSEGVLVGDIIYDDTGAALFTVTDVGAPLPVGDLKCLNITSGNPGPTWDDPKFGFKIMHPTTAQLQVTAVSGSSLTVRNVLGGTPPGASAFTDLYYEIVVPDSLTDLSYTIEKTVSGTGLSGSVLSTYTARKNDILTAPIEVSSTTREELLGPAVPANPLGYAAYLALLNSNYTIFALQVEEDTLLSWTTALEGLKSNRFYIVCPLTNNENVLSAYRTFINLESTPEKKRDKIMFQCGEIDRIDTRIDRTDPPGTVSYNKGAINTTVTVTGYDLSAYGVVVGDVFEGVSPACSGRIITIVSGVSTVLTIVNDPGLPGGPGTISGWLVRSKDLTDAQYADKIAVYAGAIGDRRIRNVYPDWAEFVFTDDTDPADISGFYGGGDITMTLPNYYGTAAIAAARASQKPAKSLTAFPITGINRLLNPFGDVYAGGSEDNNDKVLDGGNWLLSQLVTGGDVTAVRAISTDVSDVKKLEDSVTFQVDNFARMLRAQITPLLGPYNMEDGFFDLVNANVGAVRTTVIEAKDAKDIKYLGIEEVPEALDTFKLTFEFTPYIAAAKGIVYIYV